MSGIVARRCAVCGTAAGRLEQHHLAARANDPALLVTICRPCHDVSTDWQLALGILRRESLDERAKHSDLERRWAVFQGLALAMLMAVPEDHAPAWVRFSRAAGTFHKVREEQAAQDARWGPKPARTPSGRPRPTRRGRADPSCVLSLILEAGDKLLSDDPNWPRLRANVVTMASTAAQEETPASWYPAIELLEVTLDDLVELKGSDDLEGSRTDRERTLQAIADVLVGRGARTSPAAPRRAEQGPGPQPDG